jgi:hypothetical protein
LKITCNLLIILYIELRLFINHNKQELKANKQALRHPQDKGKQINSDRAVFLRLTEKYSTFLYNVYVYSVVFR